MAAYDHICFHANVVLMFLYLMDACIQPGVRVAGICSSLLRAHLVVSCTCTMVAACLWCRMYTLAPRTAAQHGSRTLGTWYVDCMHSIPSHSFSASFCASACAVLFWLNHVPEPAGYRIQAWFFQSMFLAEDSCMFCVLCVT